MPVRVEKIDDFDWVGAVSSLPDPNWAGLGVVIHVDGAAGHIRCKRRDRPRLPVEKINDRDWVEAVRRFPDPRGLETLQRRRNRARVPPDALTLADTYSIYRCSTGYQRY